MPPLVLSLWSKPIGVTAADAGTPADVAGPAAAADVVDATAAAEVAQHRFLGQVTLAPAALLALVGVAPGATADVNGDADAAAAAFDVPPPYVEQTYELQGRSSKSHVTGSIRLGFQRLMPAVLAAREGSDAVPVPRPSRWSHGDVFWAHPDDAAEAYGELYKRLFEVLIDASVPGRQKAQ
ncbi:hypothetical protein CAUPRSCDRAFT_13083, partial [Caulochytrium protostelioides]